MSSLGFIIDKLKYYYIGLNRHYKIDIYDKKTLRYVRSETLCSSDVSKFRIGNYNEHTSINCKECIYIKNRTNE